MNDSSEKSKILDSLDKSDLEKARNRMIAEGYRYRSLENRHSESDSEDDTVKKRQTGQQRFLQKSFVLLLALAVVIIAVLAGVIVWQYFQKSAPEQVCYSPECVQASAYILSKMDRTVDPCQDFYRYTCGNWMKTTKIPPSRSHYNIFSEIDDQNKQKIKAILEKSSAMIQKNQSSAVEKAITYYHICMDEDTVEKQGVDPVIKFIRDLHSWPLTSAHGLTWTEASWDFLQALTANHINGFSALFRMSVSVDDKNSSRYIIAFEQSGLSLASREEYFSNHSNYKKIQNGFMEFGGKIGELLGGDNSTVWAGMTDIYNLETQLAQIHVPQEELLDPAKTYHKMKVSELQDLIGSLKLDLKAYLRQVLGRDLGDTSVLVYTPKFFRELGGVLNKTSSRVLANYIVWSAVNAQVGYFPSKFIEASFLLSKVESGIAAVDPRWQRCVSKVNSAFGYASSALYVQRHFAKESRSKVLDIVKEIEDAFIKGIPLVSWMDEKTREIAIEKVRKIVQMIGYPDWILDSVRLDKYYENVTLVAGEFLMSHLNIRRESVLRNYNKLGTVPDRQEWHMMPVETNAYYSQSNNQIVFPAGILQRPFFTPSFPMSFNFGTTGMIIGHEMTHGFDNKGRHYDKYGNLNNWWTDQSTSSFQSKTSCMVRQYSNYTAENTHLKGERVLGENIADNGGLKTAYMAYRHWVKSQNSNEVKDLPGLTLTQEQLFFVGFGQLWCSYYTPQYTKQAILTDEHTISKFRTIGVVSNSGDFARAFQCAPSTPMNPQIKCQVW